MNFFRKSWISLIWHKIANFCDFGTNLLVLGVQKNINIIRRPSLEVDEKKLWKWDMTIFQKSKGKLGEIRFFRAKTLKIAK